MHTRSAVSNDVEEVLSTDGALHVKVESGVVFTNTAVAVGIASAEALAANTARKYLLIQNKHATGVIYANFGAAATTANGIKIGPGENFPFEWNAPTNAIHLIGDVANADVVIVEG